MQIYAYNGVIHLLKHKCVYANVPVILTNIHFLIYVYVSMQN